MVACILAAKEAVFSSVLTVARHLGVHHTQVRTYTRTSEWAAPSCAEAAGNKEALWEGEPKPSAAPPAGSPYEGAQKHRRFQIYVHSKLMIVDDEVHCGPVVLIDTHATITQ